jgi:hypothetical protein
MADGTRELRVQVDPLPDADAEELAQLADQLRRELDNLDDVESVKPVREGTPPEGAKAIDVLAVGALAVKLAPAAVGLVARLVQQWLSRSNARGAKLQIDGDVIELDRARREDNDRLIALLEAKHGSRG